MQCSSTVFGYLTVNSQAFKVTTQYNNFPSAENALLFASKSLML